MAELTPPTAEPREGLVERLGMLRPLAIRDFALLWTGMTISLFGDGIFFVAIAWQVYELSNAPTALSVVGIAWTLPMVAFLLVGGVVSDRFDRRRVMIVSDVFRFLAVGAIGLLSISGELSLAILLGLVAVYGAADALFPPAFGAIVPDIVPQHLLLEANSIDMFVRTLMSRMAGPAVGGLAIGWFSTGGAFLLDAGTFLASAVCFALISARPAAAREEGSTAFREIAEGFRFVRSHVWLWGTLVAAAVSLLAFYGPWEVLVPYIVKNLLEGSAGDLGIVYASGGLGAILAALVMAQRSLPRRHMTFMYVMWTLAAGAEAIYGFASELWHAMVAAFIAGSLSTGGMIVWMTLVQQRVPRRLLGRVTSLDWFVSIGLIPVSYALTGPISEAVGVRETMIGAGIAGALITAAFLFLPGMRETERARSG